MRIIDIIDGTTVDGPGFRTSIYFAGCTHHCPGCQNPQTWDPETGYDISIEELMNRIETNEMNVTFSGGDPLFQIDELLELAKAIKQKGKTIWCYTGYRYEDVYRDSKLSRILQTIDVLVDGPFIESLCDTSLIFRGSSNQRLIDVRYSSADKIIEWTPDF